MSSLRHRLTALETPGGYATIGDMLDALSAGTDMPCNIDPRITAFLDRPDILLIDKINTNTDLPRYAMHSCQEGIQ